MSYTGEIPDTSEKIKIFLKLILRKRRIKLTNFWKSLNRTLDISLAKFMRPENQNLVESFDEAKLVEATENLNIHKSQIIYRSATKKNMPTCGRSYKIFRTWPMERSFLNSITFFAVAGKDYQQQSCTLIHLKQRRTNHFLKNETELVFLWSYEGHQKLSFENLFLYHLYEHIDFGLWDTNKYRITHFHLDRKLQALLLIGCAGFWKVCQNYNNNKVFVKSLSILQLNGLRHAMNYNFYDMQKYLVRNFKI